MTDGVAPVRPEGDPDAALLEGLRRGDREAFAVLVRRYQSRLLRVASTFVRSPAVAEEVVQETWVAVIRGIERFEGRSSVRTWLFRILVNRARTAASREPVATVPLDDGTGLEGRFDEQGAWSPPPVPWTDQVDERLLAASLAGRVRELLVELPPAQRQVFVLRDVEGVDAGSVCELLGLTPGNQRVLLHRARNRIRARLEVEIGGRP